jgi:phospholipid transport system substrate-binding protein
VTRLISLIVGAFDPRKLFVALALAPLALAFFASDGARAESVAAYVQRVQNDLISAQRANSKTAYAAVLRQHMDVPYVGLTALGGDYANALPKADRPNFYNGVIRFIADYGTKDGPKYPVASAVVTGIGEETKGGAEVDTRITLRSGESYDVRWSLVRSGQTFKVRDASVGIFSARDQLQRLFQNWLDENGKNPRSLVVVLNKF